MRKASGEDISGEAPVLVQAGFRPDQRKRAPWARLVEELVEAKRCKDQAFEQLVEVKAQQRAEKIALYGEDGGAAGVRGGRPVINVQEDRRGPFNDEDKGNRIYPGQARRRQDQDPWEGLAIIAFMDKKREEHAGEDAYWRAVLMRYRPKDKAQLQGIYARKALFEERVVRLNLGKGTRGSKRSSAGMTGVMKYAVSESSGCRAPGGGRKDEFKEYKEKVKAWSWKERDHGHSLHAGDLWQEYKFVLEEAI